MANFTQFPEDWQFLFRNAVKAEQFVYDDPVVCGLYCRKTLEAWVDWIYENEPSLTLPFDKSIHNLMMQPEFINLFDPVVLKHMHTVRVLGNSGIHGKSKLPIKLEEALHALELTYGFVGYLINLYSNDYEVFPKFDTAKIPLAQKIQSSQAKAEIEKLKKELTEVRELHKQSLEAQKVAEENRKTNKVEVVIPTDPNEELTRKIYIDTYLQEAHWDLSNPKVAEFQVDYMPNKSNKGYVDYVLWGKDGKPLAVVEAKNTNVDVTVGREQAELYAKALEQTFGQLPNVFLTNGYEIYLYDWETPLRKVYGFYTQEELQRNIDRRTSRSEIGSIEINNEITDRYYQKAAIKAVGDRFEGKHRGALLVMATGTGKTRTAASIIDVLAKAGWVKNVLFLADRVALVSQAKQNLNTYLPNFPSVSLLEENEKSTSRLVFSTYNTLLNLIDDVKADDGKFYGVGHFDLIIFDEIHRSVYNKYRAIFEYFDGFKIGLTATPRQDQIQSDTYELFGLPQGNPTFSYGLATAVQDGYLVDYKSYSVETNFRRNGIKYAELSEEEKIEYEEKFGDPLTGEFPDEIEATALDKWLYNNNTADLILDMLMTRGIKVNNGTELGKTIIFARRREHAEFIRKRFNANYPQYGDQFLKVIDYKTKYSDSILSDFKNKDKYPVIASSVDMLDTGIDVPEVVNLVFLKPVKSPIKFWQMIGRGTRLCPGLIGAGEDKKEFLILDFCENFEEFGENKQQKELNRQMSVNEKLFLIRLKLSQILIHETGELKNFGDDLLNYLHHQVQTLYSTGKNSFIVRRNLKTIEHFTRFENWQDMQEQDIRKLNVEVGPLVFDNDKDNSAKLFDILIYDLILNLLNGDRRQVNIINRIRNIGNQLQKKQSIPMVKDKIGFVQKISDAEYWSEVSPLIAEKVRIEIRELIKFLDSESTEIIVTNFEDEITKIEESPPVYEAQTFDKNAYKMKVEQYILENKLNLTIDKLRKNIKITKSELENLEKMLFEQGDLGNKERFSEVFGNQPLGKFIRSIVGLDVGAAKEAFSELISNANLNQKQITFLNMIIDHFSKRGFITSDLLFEPPFTNVDSLGIVHLFGEEKSREIEAIIDRINANSEVG